MKKEFAVSISLDDFNRGQLELDEYPHMLSMEDGKIYGDYAKKMKVATIELELPIPPIEELLKRADDEQEAIQLLAIEQQEEKLQRMKEAFQNQGKAMYLAG